MPNNDSHQHVVKTSEQWNERIVEFWVVPRGCLCVELTPRGKTKLKIGEGNKYYSQLPYICDDDLSQYYTKTEVDNLLENFNRMAIMSTEEYDEKSDLPPTGNKLGDVRFVKSQNPSIKIDPDIYLWNGLKWVFVGDKFQDIDLSKYLKKTEFHELFDPVKEKVDEMYPMRHTHENKDVLDQITAPFTVPEKEKLAGLENYDDTEIRELIHESGHTHPNKELLDTITPDSLWSESDREKFDSLHNYDDTEVKVRIEVLENISHTHENKEILDQITAPFTTEDKTKLDSLHNDEVFRGTDGRYPGTSGNVPAPSTLDIGKFLSSDGTWKPAGYDIDFIGATENTNGMHGLVPAPLAGQESYYLRGDGTWAMIEKPIEYKAGAGISIYDTLFELSEDTVTNTVYLFDTQVTSNVSGRIFTKYNTEPALGAVVYASFYTQPFFVGLTADSVKYGTNYDSHIWPDPDHPPFEYKGVTWYYSGNAYGMPGDVTDSSGHIQKLPGNYSVATEEDLQNIARAIIDAADIIMSPSKTISAKLGSGLQFDSNNAVELDKATTETIGGVIVGDGLNIDANGVLSIDSSSSTGEYEAGDAIRFTKHTPEILPAEYQLVDYIQSTGEQGIELNYIPASSYIKYELTFSDIEFVVNDDFHYLIGGWASAVDMRPPSIAYNFVLWPNKVDVPCGRTDTITNGEVPSDMTVPHTYTLTVSNGSISLQLDNGVVRTSSYSGNISQKVGLFCAPSNVAGDPSAIFQTAAYRFRELKIYEGNSSSNLTLIHHYYPCYRISDDEPGIYDVITDTFLTNLGTGDLIIGPITGVPAINVQYGEGLEVDNNNDLNVKLGAGLYFDADGAIAASGDNDYTAGEGIDITGTTRPIDINYIRLDINNSRDNGRGGIIQFRNIRVLDTNSNSLQFSHASSVYGDGSVVVYGQNSRDESPQAMIEGRNKTCCTNFSLTKAPLKITFTLTSATSIANITAFSILTGADHTERDPVSWDIYASNDGMTWYKIQEAHSPDVTTARSTWITNIPFVIPPDAVEVLPGVKTIKAKIGEGLSFDSNDAIQNEGLLSVTQDFDDKNRLTFGTTYGDIIIDIPTGGGGDSSETYVAGDAVSLHNSTAPLTAPLTHFKWEISQTRAKAEGTVYVTLQVDEIEFYDENDQLITFSAIAGSFKSNSPNPPSPSYATTPTVQTPDKIIDNDITTKCCVTNFTSELDAMVFIFELDSTNPITAQDIKCYRYYTADNDTSADPVTWTLSVSPDGIEWFIVDTQTEFNAPTARETSTDYFTMTKPTIPAKSINVKYDDGLMLDAHGDLVVQTGKGIEISDNAVTAKLGVGLTFDNIDAITLDETIDLALNCDYSQ